MWRPRPSVCLSACVSDQTQATTTFMNFGVALCPMSWPAKERFMDTGAVKSHFSYELTAICAAVTTTTSTTITITTTTTSTFFHILSCYLASVRSHDLHPFKISQPALLSGVTTCPSFRSCLVSSSHILTPAFLSHLATCPPSDHASCFQSAPASYPPFRSCHLSSSSSSCS